MPEPAAPPTPAEPAPGTSPEARALAAEPATACANCGAVLPGRFCPACGQKAEPLRQPVHRLAMDSFTEFFGVDGRVWRSFGALLGIPGKLTAEFLAGRRMRYLRPFRLYLTATLVFFLLLTLLDPVAAIEREIGEGDAAADTTLRAADRIAALDAALARGPDVDTAAAPDSAAAGDDARGPQTYRFGWGLDEPADSLRGVGAGIRDSLADAHGLDPEERLEWERDSTRLAVQRDWLARLPADSLVDPARVERAATLLVPDPGGFQMSFDTGRIQPGALARRVQQAETRAERSAAIGDLVRGSIGRVPTVMFLLLPLFAAMLKLLYVRRGWFYSEHVVFALHTHAVAFVALTLVTALLWADARGAGWTVARGVLLALPVHFVLAQKRVYGQSWGKTLAKAAALGGMYAFTLLCGLVAAVALAVFFG